MIYKSKDKVKQIPYNIKSLFPVGFFGSLVHLFQMIAIKLTLVAYVISIKRTSAVISVLFGFLIFKEKGIKERFIGALIMILGVLFIILAD